MPLSQLTGVGRFCFNLFSPFLSMVRILFSQVISFQILLYTLVLPFLWLTLLLFPVILSTITSQMASNYHIFDLPNNTHPTPKNISRHLIDQYHPLHHLDHTMLRHIRPHLIHNSKFPPFTAGQQNWSITTLINLLLLLQR